MLIPIKSTSLAPVVLTGELEGLELLPGQTLTIDISQTNQTLLVLLRFQMRGVLSLPRQFSRLASLQLALTNAANGAEPTDALPGDAVWSTTDNAVRIYTGGDRSTGFLGSGWRTVGEDFWGVGSDQPGPGVLMGSLTLLLDGGALLVGGIRHSETGLGIGGGVGFTTALSDVYRFDAASQTWRRVASLPAARAHAGIATLRDGRVLVVGGWENDGLVANMKANTFIYDPATDSWSEAGLYPQPIAWAYQYNNTAFAGLDDGRLLAVGGIVGSKVCNGPLLHVENCYGTGAGAVFTPATGTWHPVGNSLPYLQAHVHAAKLPDGRVLIPGDQNIGIDSGLPSNTEIVGQTAHCVVFDPAANLFYPVASMPAIIGEDEFNEPGNRGRYAHVVLADGRVLVAMGRAMQTAPPSTVVDRRSCVIYSAQNNTWTETALCPLTARHDLLAVLLPDGNVYVGGGSNEDGQLVDGAIYNPIKDSWTMAARQPSAGTSSLNTTPFASWCKLTTGQLLVAGGGKPASDLIEDPAVAGLAAYLPGSTTTLIYNPPA